MNSAKFYVRDFSDDPLSRSPPHRISSVSLQCSRALTHKAEGDVRSPYIKLQVVAQRHSLKSTRNFLARSIAHA